MTNAMMSLGVIAAVFAGAMLVAGAQSSNNPTPSLAPALSTVANYNYETIRGTGNITYAVGPTYTFLGSPAAPAGAIYHQVVDVFYDAEGNKLQTKSMTHAVNEYCHPGMRRQEDLLAQDDGKGNVRFVAALLPGEPAVGVRPVTQEGRVRATLAIRETPVAPDSASPEATIAISGRRSRLLR